jgi:hypothetical protein
MTCSRTSTRNGSCGASTVTRANRMITATANEEQNSVVIAVLVGGQQ